MSRNWHSWDKAGPDGDISAHVEMATLERFRYVLQAEMPDMMLADVSIGRLRDDMLRRFVWRLHADVFGEHLEQAKITHPLDWREAVKERLYQALVEGKHWPWFGEYARKRWPVQYKQVEIDVRALYPHISAPHEQHRIVVVRQESVARAPSTWTPRKPAALPSGWFDMKTRQQSLYETLRELRYYLPGGGDWYVGRKVYHELMKMFDPITGEGLVNFQFDSSVRPMFGCPVKVDLTIPDDTIELRDYAGRVVGKIYNIL